MTLSNHLLWASALVFPLMCGCAGDQPAGEPAPDVPGGPGQTVQDGRSESDDPDQESSPVAPDEGPVGGDDDVAPAGVPDTEPDLVESAGPVISGGILLVELEAPPVLWATAGARFTAEETVGEDPDGCAVSWSDPGEETPPSFGYSAGVLSVAGTEPEVVFTPQDEGDHGAGYASNLPEELETLLPSGGALLTISAEGGADIGPYTQVLQTPEPVVLLGPPTGLVGLGFASVTTNGDLEVTWAPGNGESVVVSLSPLGADFEVEAGYGMTCTLDGDEGAHTVPQWALEEVRDGSSKRRVALGVTRVKSRTDQVEGASVSVGATRSFVGLLDLTP